MGVRPHHHRGIPALAGHSDQTAHVSTGKKLLLRRGFPEARPACWGTPETFRAVWVLGWGETEVRRMWVLSPGETPDARKMGVSPGRE